MISHANADSEIANGEKAGFYRVNGFVSWIPGAGDITRAQFYEACKVCRKKVTSEQAGYNCINCDQIFPDCQYIYNFSGLF